VARPAKGVVRLYSLIDHTDSGFAVKALNAAGDLDGFEPRKSRKSRKAAAIAEVIFLSLFSCISWLSANLTSHEWNHG
jgi:hypothetical protein